MYIRTPQTRKRAYAPPPPIGRRTLTLAKTPLMNIFPMNIANRGIVEEMEKGEREREESFKGFRSETRAGLEAIGASGGPVGAAVAVASGR